MSKKKRNKLDWLKASWPYIVTAALVLAVVFFGSLDKRNINGTLNLDVFAESEYKVSVDQLSELYVVADLSDALRLTSAQDVATNYVVTATMYKSGQTSAGKLEKPGLTDIEASRGVVEYVLAEGESLDDVAAKYNISTDQIRWSNGLKTTDVSVGTTLYVPSISGIVYTVKEDDTIESIADKYGSNVDEIITLNDLELVGIKEGDRILIKDGSLPEKERPEYVAPVVPTYTRTYTYTYLGSSSIRQDIEVVGYFYGLGGPYAGGQCTQWAWYKRPDLPSNLGNANTWAARAAAAGYTVNRTPSAGAVFQTPSGWYGHVGYVESVNWDGSIVISEMNYGVPYRVIRSTVPASAVGSFNYIH